MMSLRLSVTLTAVLLGVSPHATAKERRLLLHKLIPQRTPKRRQILTAKQPAMPKPDAAQSAKTARLQGTKRQRITRPMARPMAQKVAKRCLLSSWKRRSNCQGKNPPIRGSRGGDLAAFRSHDCSKKDSSFSVLGTFKRLLPKYGIASYIHGTFIGGFSFRTFPGAESDLLNDHPGKIARASGLTSSLFVGAELYNRVFVEAQLGYDAALNRLESTYSYIDLRIFKDFLFVRGGKFFVPMGGLNVYPDPAYMFP